MPRRRSKHVVPYGVILVTVTSALSSLVVILHIHLPGNKPWYEGVWADVWTFGFTTVMFTSCAGSRVWKLVSSLWEYVHQNKYSLLTEQIISFFQQGQPALCHTSQKRSHWTWSPATPSFLFLSFSRHHDHMWGGSGSNVRFRTGCLLRLPYITGQQ